MEGTVGLAAARQGMRVLFISTGDPDLRAMQFGSQFVFRWEGLNF